MNPRPGSHRLFCAAILLVSAGACGAAWNLPYPQPARYDARSSYSADLLTYLAAVPGYLDSSMRKGWTYYKANYLMSNGLVNQMQGVNVGTNVAVSEGQGYGMLLALLCNDQATFNRIFEAANTYMWDDGHQSYFKWQWPSASQGAATDADLDVGLSLVFADALQQKGRWQSYSKNGITYASRALQIIKSIRTAMCSSDYLLPGDNWGGDGINNLNPSYFAVAWLKVFDAYQTQYDFTPVIDKCYQVLRSRAAQYNLGQAPDWCTTSGGQASKGGLGMGNDAIRVPWRIAMDALWFGDSRAVEFCRNSRNTLTQWANTTRTMMVAQMAQYDASGTAVASTKGSFSEAAMWACAIAGSKDTAYAHQGLNAVVFGRITGSYDCFGDKSLSDQYYYYKQSLGMLGFAAISGQFPDVLDDMRTIMPASPVSTDAATGTAGAVFQTPRGLAIVLPRRHFSSCKLTHIDVYDLQGARLVSQELSARAQAGTTIMLSPPQMMLPPGSYVTAVEAMTTDRPATWIVNRLAWR